MYLAVKKLFKCPRFAQTKAIVKKYLDVPKF